MEFKKTLIFIFLILVLVGNGFSLESKIPETVSEIQVGGTIYTRDNINKDFWTVKDSLSGSSKVRYINSNSVITEVITDANGKGLFNVKNDVTIKTKSSQEYIFQTSGVSNFESESNLKALESYFNLDVQTISSSNIKSVSNSQEGFSYGLDKDNKVYIRNIDGSWSLIENAYAADVTKLNSYSEFETYVENTKDNSIKSINQPSTSSSDINPNSNSQDLANSNSLGEETPTVNNGCTIGSYDSIKKICVNIETKKTSTGTSYTISKYYNQDGSIIVEPNSAIIEAKVKEIETINNAGGTLNLNFNDINEVIANALINNEVINNEILSNLNKNELEYIYSKGGVNSESAFNIYLVKEDDTKIQERFKESKTDIEKQLILDFYVINKDGIYTEDEKSIIINNLCSETKDCIKYLIKTEEGTKYVFEKMSAKQQAEAFKTLSGDEAKNFLLGSISSDNFDTICSGDEKKCQQILMTEAMNNGEFREKARDKLKTKITDGSLEITEDQAADLVLTSGSEAEKKEFAQAYNGLDCSSFFQSIWCSITGKNNANQLIQKAVQKSVTETIANTQKISVPKEVKDNFCDIDKSVAECQTKYNECQIEKNKKSDDCKNVKNFERDTSLYSSYGKLDENSVTKLNQEIKVDILSKLNLDGLNGNNIEKIATACKEMNDNCTKVINEEFLGCKSNVETCQIIKQALEIADKNTPVRVGWTYSIIDAIKNPDQSGLKTAKLFGFEANYENVPEMLRESVPSQMCLDKIDGYLDKEIETNGGVTKYGCDSYDASTEPDKHCLEVMGDLRAQRSSITPDNKTLVTYSYYVKNPENPFSLSVKYVQQGNWRVFTLENSSSTKGFDSVNIPLNDSTGIEPNSFTINLDSGDLHLTYPIVLISTGALKSTLETNGNAAGNEGANINANING